MDKPDLDPQAAGADDEIVGLAKLFAVACARDARAEMASPSTKQADAWTALSSALDACGGRLADRDAAKAQAMDLGAAVTGEVREGLKAPGAAVTGAWKAFKDAMAPLTAPT